MLKLILSCICDCESDPIQKRNACSEFKKILLRRRSNDYLYPMKMKCVGIGKTVSVYGLEQVQTYVKRIQRFIPFEWVELKEVKHHKNNPTTALQAEEELIRKHVSDRDALILFDEKGKQMDSRAFAQFIDKHSVTHGGTLVFCLGGAYGFSDSLRKRANGMVSLSPMTFPHQLARVVALEQLYRACTINNHHPYHH